MHRSARESRLGLLAAVSGVCWLLWGALEASTSVLHGDNLHTTFDVIYIACFDVALFTIAAVLNGLRITTSGAPASVAGRGAATGALLLALFVTLDAAIPDTALFNVLSFAGTITFWLCGIAFGVAIARAGELPRAYGWLLAIAMLLFAPLAEIGGSIPLAIVLLALAGHTLGAKTAVSPRQAAWAYEPDL